MLTGRTRWSAGWFGKIVLQVEYDWHGMPAYSRHIEHETRWRDATADDIAKNPAIARQCNSVAEMH